KQPSNAPGRYVVRFLDNPGPALIDLPESAYDTVLHAPVALGASKPTVALTPLSPSSFLRLLRFTMSTPRTPCLHQGSSSHA
ncbi:unnamed protein product, partial [Ascophyllum nodosum]